MMVVLFVAALLLLHLAVVFIRCQIIKGDTWDILAEISDERSPQQCDVVMQGWVFRRHGFVKVHVIASDGVVGLKVAFAPDLIFLASYFLPYRKINISRISVQNETCGVQKCVIECGDPIRNVQLWIRLASSPGGAGFRNFRCRDRWVV